MNPQYPGYGQDPYQQQPYGTPNYYAGPGYPGYPPSRGTNAMAIVALVCGLAFAPLGIVFGHIALSQIKRTGEDGRGLAIAGLVLGYVTTLFAILAIAFVIIMAIIASSVESNYNDYDYYSMATSGTSMAASQTIAYTSTTLGWPRV